MFGWCCGGGNSIRVKAGFLVCERLVRVRSRREGSPCKVGLFSEDFCVRLVLTACFVKICQGIDAVCYTPGSTFPVVLGSKVDL